MKILVVGGGGREHALCSALRRSAFVEELFCAPGNPGIAELADCVPVAPGDIVEIADLAETLQLDLTVVGPELPLSLGIVDEFHKRNLPIFGPSRLATQIESSKVFAKEFFRRHGIATAQAIVCSNRSEAEGVRVSGITILKADGLAAERDSPVESEQEADRVLTLFSKSESSDRRAIAWWWKSSSRGARRRSSRCATARPPSRCRRRAITRRSTMETAAPTREEWAVTRPPVFSTPPHLRRF